MRSFTFFDILYRVLSFYYPTTYVRNITDIDDKIITKAQEEGKTPKVLTEEVYREFIVEANLLNLRRPTFEPVVTKYIPKIIQAIQDLIEKGIGYQKEDGIYFAISKLDQEHKYNLFGCSMRHEEDFALWKYKTDFGWDAPFGHGRPGWHIECTVMAQSTIMLPFDLHCGGRDLMFPHHTNEEAQGYALYRAKTANYWVHTNFINIEDMKMSKSLGNTLTVSGLDIHPMIIKVAFLLTHYRQELFWSDQALREAAALYNKWRKLLGQYGAKSGGYPTRNFLECILEDMNTPLALKVLDSDITEENCGDIMASFGLLGIDFEFGYLTDTQITALVMARQAARLEENFNKADEIRIKLDTLKVKLEESKESVRWYQEV
jgi:cysteinyl-tRNA synthetase